MNMSGEGSSNDSGMQGRPGSRTNRWSMNDDQKEAPKSSEVPGKEGSLPESSQTVHVMWDDPTGRLEQERLAHKLQRACSPTQDVNNLQEMMDAQFSDVEEGEEEENPVPQLSEVTNTTQQAPTHTSNVCCVIDRQSDCTVGKSTAKLLIGDKNECCIMP